LKKQAVLSQLRCLYSTHCFEAHESTYTLLQSSSCRPKPTCMRPWSPLNLQLSNSWTCLLKQRRDVCLDLSPEPRELLHRRREFYLHLAASSHLTSKSEHFIPPHRSRISELQHIRLGTYTYINVTRGGAHQTCDYDILPPLSSLSTSPISTTRMHVTTITNNPSPSLN
jgi:hypothetical protein